MIYLGDIPKDQTIRFMWPTCEAGGASVTRATDGTIHVYKDGASGTEVTTGVTDTEDFDSLTGVHLCEIVTTDEFYTGGCDYMVVLKAATIDGEAVNYPLAQFSIQNRFMRGTNNAALVSMCTEARLAQLDVANLPGDVAAILADTNELQTDDIPGVLSTIEGQVDTVDGIVDSILADTNELQVDDVPGLIGALNDLTAAQVNAECDTALAEYDGPTKAEMDTIETDTQNIQSRLPAALVSGRMSSDAVAISGSTTAADVMEQFFANAVLMGAVNDASATTTSFKTTLTDLGFSADKITDDAAITFLTGNLQGQTRKIDDYVDADGVVTVLVPFTEAPADTDTFMVLGRLE